MAKVKRFWMVKGMGEPHASHDSEELATAEAMRLARINPGQYFYIMESIKVVKKTEVTIVDLRNGNADKDIPF